MTTNIKIKNEVNILPLYKLTLITLCLIVWQCTFAQNEQLIIEGSIVISDSESDNPLAGTIKWTGQDFEGFDGTSWKSLTCGCDDETETDAILTCPSVDFEIDNCNLTVNWTHNNPGSNIVNYDLRLYHVSKPNGVDPGLSVTYPATSNTVSICDPQKLGISSGSGSIDVELLYWYDGDTDAIISAGTCTVNYDFPTDNGIGKTFAQIEADTELPNFCNESDDAYVAEYLYQNEDVLYWEVQTMSNGQKKVVPIAVQEIPTDGSAILLPAPSGGDDTQALETVINGNGTNKVFVGSGSYKVNQLDIDKAGTVIHNMKVTPASGAGELIHINADDVRLIDCPQDMQNQGSAYLGIYAQFADRFHLIRSGLTNMFHTQGNSGGGVRIRECADFHIAGGVYKQIWNKKSGTNTCRANAFWVTSWQSDGNYGTTNGGYIVNNVAEDLQSTGEPTSGHHDGEFLTIQSNANHIKPIKIFANQCVDAGKRLIKVQADGGATVLSNFYEWKTTESSGLGRRTRLSMISVQLGMGDMEARNNRLTVNGDDNWSYIMIISSSNQSGSNIHFDCNLIEINNPWNGAGYDQCVFVAFSGGAGSNGNDSSQENINCTMNDNTIFGTGGVNYHYWFGRGYDVNSGPMQPTGNVFNLTDPDSPHQGIERKNGPN